MWIWKLLRALPLLWQVGLALALLATATGGYFAWKHAIFQQGYDNAMDKVDARNEDAARDVRAALRKPRACRDANGHWDVSRGVCE